MRWSNRCSSVVGTDGWWHGAYGWSNKPPPRVRTTPSRFIKYRWVSQASKEGAVSKKLIQWHARHRHHISRTQLLIQLWQLTLVVGLYVGFTSKVKRLWAYGWPKKNLLGAENVEPAVVMLPSLEIGHQKNSDNPMTSRHTAGGKNHRSYFWLDYLTGNHSDSLDL